jgi:hypothetical protein
VHLDGNDWAMEAVLLMRRCELSPVLGVARAGMRGFGHDTVGFRACTSKTARGAACPISLGSGQMVRHAGCTMPCTSMCGAVQMVGCARGNAHSGLDVPGRHRRVQSGAVAWPMGVLGGRA